jgi:hypothetical protein
VAGPSRARQSIGTSRVGIASTLSPDGPVADSSAQPTRTRMYRRIRRSPPWPRTHQPTIGRRNKDRRYIAVLLVDNGSAAYLAEVFGARLPTCSG